MAEWAGKPNPVRQQSDVVIIHLGRRSPADSSTLPTASGSDFEKPHQRDGPPLAAYLGLLAVGFTLPQPSPAARCALTAPFHRYRLETRH